MVLDGCILGFKTGYRHISKIPLEVIPSVLMTSFSSFKMAHCFPDLAGEMDIISDSEVSL